MAFFEDLGDSLGRFGKTVAGRAKNAAETSNLKLQIGSAQKEVTKAYAELGKKFAELNPDCADENLKPYFDAVTEALAKVSSLEQGIEDSRNLMKEAEAKMAQEAAEAKARAEQEAAEMKARKAAEDAETLSKLEEVAKETEEDQSTNYGDDEDGMPGS